MCGTGTNLAGYQVDKILARNCVPPRAPPLSPPAAPLCRATLSYKLGLPVIWWNFRHVLHGTLWSCVIPLVNSPHTNTLNHFTPYILTAFSILMFLLSDLFLACWISGLPHPNWVRRPLCELVYSPCVLMAFLQVLCDLKMSRTSCDWVNFKHVTNGMSWSCIKPEVTSQPHPGPSPIKEANQLMHPKH